MAIGFDEDSAILALNDKDETFDEWKLKNAPEDTGEDYDLAGAFNANLHPAESGHFPDTFKKPNHPTFSNQSVYSTGDQSGGEWSKDEQGNDTFKPSSWMGSDPARQEGLRSYFKEKEPNATLIDPDPYVEPFDPSTAIPREEHIKNLVNDPTFDPARHKDLGVSKEDAFEVRQKKKDRTIVEKTKAFASGISGATFAEAAKGVAKFIGGLAVMTGEGVTQTVGPAVSAILKGLGYNALAKNVDNELRVEQREIALGASRGEESVKSLGRTAKEFSGDISHWMSGGPRDNDKEKADFDEDIAAADREKQLQEGKFIEGSVVSKIAKAGSNIFGEGKDIESTIGAKRLEEEGARKENELVVEMLSAGMDPVNIAMMVSGVATGGATSIAGKAATALAKAGVSGRVAASVIRAGMATASGVAYIPKLIANTATSTLGAAASFPFKVIRAIPSRLGRIARVGDTGITAGMAIEAALHPAIALKAAGIAATAKFLGILGEGLSAAGRTGATALDQKILTGSTLGQKNLLLKGSRALGEGVNKFIKSSIDFDPVNLISSGGDPNKFADETIAAGMFGGTFAAKAHFRRSVQKGLNVRAHEALMVVDGERNYTDINPNIFAFHQGNLMRFDEGTQREIKKARHFANGMGTDIIVLSPEQADYINANRAKFNFDIPSEFKRSSAAHISSDGRILINTGTLGILDGKAGFFGGGMQNQAHLHEIGHAVLDTIGKSIETTHGQQVVKILDSALTKEEFEAAGLAYVKSLYKEVGPAQEAALRQLKDDPLIHKDEILSEISRSLLRGQDLASYGFSQESNRIITSKFGKTMHDIMRALGMGLTQMDFGAYDTKVDISGKMGPQFGQVWNQELAKAYNTLLHEYGQRATRKMRGTLTDADREFYQKLKEKSPVPPKNVAEEATPEATPEKIGHLTPKEILDAHKSDLTDPIGAVIDAHKAKSEADNKGGLTVEIHNEGDSAKEFRTVDGVLIKGDSFSEYILDQVLVGTERRPLTQEERDIITSLNTGGVNGFVYGHAGTVENLIIDATRRREQILNPAKARINDPTLQQKEQKRALFVNAVFNEKTREITLQMLSVDKLNNNYKNLVESINIANERGANIVNPYTSEVEVVADLKSYAENYKNNYLGDGAGVAKDANGVPLVPSGTPIPIPNERFDFINLLLANESAKNETPLGLARRRIAEANGIDLGADRESNPLRGQLNAALGPKWSSRTLESPHEILRPELISEINGDITSVGGLRNVGPEFNEAFDKGIPDENMVAGNYMPAPIEIREQGTKQHLEFWDRFVENSGMKSKPRTLEALDEFIRNYAIDTYSTVSPNLFDPIKREKIRDYYKKITKDLTGRERDNLPQDQQEMSNWTDNQFDSYFTQEKVDSINPSRVKELQGSADYLLANQELYPIQVIATILEMQSAFRVDIEKNESGLFKTKITSISSTNERMPNNISSETASNVYKYIKDGIKSKEAFVKAIEDNIKKRIKDRGELKGWIKYDQSHSVEDYERLNADASGTNWCTGQSLDTAKTHLSQGDFYIYFEGGDPKIAIKTNNGVIEQVRGRGEGQNITDLKLDDAAEKFINSVDGPSGGDDFLKFKKFKSDVRTLQETNIIPKSLYQYFDVNGDLSFDSLNFGKYKETPEHLLIIDNADRSKINPFDKNGNILTSLMHPSQEIINRIKNNPPKKIAGIFFNSGDRLEFLIPILEEIGSFKNGYRYTKSSFTFNNLKKIGNVEAEHCILLNFPSALKIGKIDSMSAKSISAKNAKEVGDITCWAAEYLDFPLTIRVGDIFAARGIDLNFPLAAKVGSINSFDIKVLNFPSAKEVLEIKANSAEILNFPLVSKINGDIVAYAESELNFPLLTKFENLYVDLAKLLNFPSLKKCASINAENVESINIPIANKIESIYAPRCEFLNAPSLNNLKDSNFVYKNAKVVNIPDSFKFNLDYHQDFYKAKIICDPSITTIEQLKARVEGKDSYMPEDGGSLNSEEITLGDKNVSYMPSGKKVKEKKPKEKTEWKAGEDSLMEYEGEREQIAAVLADRFTNGLNNPNLLGPLKKLIEKYPQYLNGPLNHIVKSAVRLKLGEITHRELAKAYIMTIVSQGAGAVSLDALQRSLVNYNEKMEREEKPQIKFKINPSKIFLHTNKKGKIDVRPEEIAAYWITTKDGKKALDNLDYYAAGLTPKGLKPVEGATNPNLMPAKYRPEDFAIVKLLREFYGDDRVAGSGMMIGNEWAEGQETIRESRPSWEKEPFPSKASKRDDYGYKIQAKNEDGTLKLDWSEKKIGEVTLSNLNDALLEINENKGNNVQGMINIFLKFKGIDSAKAPFIGHFIGFGQRVTLDAVEKNYEIGGTGDSRNFAKDQQEAPYKAKKNPTIDEKKEIEKIRAEIKAKNDAVKLPFRKELEVLSGSSELQKLAREFIENKIDQIKAERLAKNPNDPIGKIPNEAFFHIMHHWIWDAAKGIKTTHKGLYKSMDTKYMPSEGIPEHYKSVDDFREHWNSLGVHNMTSIRGEGSKYEHIRPLEIEVEKDNRNNGLGSAFMKDLTAFADLNGMQININPSDELGATSIGRLGRFYKRFGFVENKSGKNKDYTISERFYRPASKYMPLEESSRYLELAKDPETNRKELQGIVDKAAKIAGNLNLYHGNTPEFGKFSYNDLGIHLGDKNSAKERLEQTGQNNGIVKNYFVDIKNAIRLKYDPDMWNAYDVAKSLPKESLKKIEENYDILNITNLELKQELKDQGFDGISYGNAFEGGESFLAFDPSQIKSADPVTYDSNGKVIPIEERFNLNNDKISYMPSEEAAGKPYNRKHDITIRAMLRNAQNQKRDLTAEEKSKINDLVGKNLPVDQVFTKDVLASMASQEKVNSAIDSKQKLSNQFDHSGNSIASPWDKVDFNQKATGRQDVPSMTRHNTGVVTIAQKGPDGKLSSIYVPFALFEDNPRLAAPQTEKIKGIGAGDAKSPDLGVISGKLSRTQKIPDDIESWTQVGFNPDRHSYFYLKSDQTKGVTGGEKIAQIGNTVFVKNPVFATPEEQASYKYMPFAGEGATGFAEAEKRGGVFVNPFDFMKRFEISDDKMESKDAWQKLMDSTASSKITIEDLYDHEELFKSYPWLRNVPVIKDLNLKSHASARDDNRIRVGDDYLRQLFYDKNPTENILAREYYLKKTIIHEIQHLIQFREKFPRGVGTSKEFLLQRLNDIEASKIKQIDQAEQKFDAIPYNELNKLKAEKINKDLIILKEDLSKWQKYYFDKYFYRNGKFIDLLSRQQLFDLYFSAVGEMESRMASDRSEFSDDYRKQNPAIYQKQAHPFLNFYREFPYPQLDAIYDAKMAEANAQRLKVDRYMPLDVFATPEEQASYKYMPFAGERATGFAEAEKRGDVFVNPFDLMKRFEIADDKMESLNAWRKLHNDGDKFDFILGDLYDHPELFKNYPWLKDLPVIVEFKNDDADASVNYDGTQINVEFQYLKKIIDTVNFNNEKYPTQQMQDRADYYLKKTMIHEIQHLIQFEEKFAMGGNSAESSLRDTLTSIKYAKQEALRKAVDKFNRSSSKDEKAAIALDVNKMRTDLDLWDQHYKNTYGFSYGKFEPVITKMQLWQLYQSLAGEMESRAAEDRSGMTSEDRKKFPVIFDIDYKDNPIVTFRLPSSEKYKSIEDANAKRLGVDRYMPLDELAEEMNIPRTLSKDYNGKQINSIMADHMEAYNFKERAMARLMGQPVSSGGQGYAIKNHGTGVVWASEPDMVTGMLGNLNRRGGKFQEEGKQGENNDWFVLVAPFTMKKDALASNNEFAKYRINQLKQWAALNPDKYESFKKDIIKWSTTLKKPKAKAAEKNYGVIKYPFYKEFDLNNFNFSTNSEGGSTFTQKKDLIQEIKRLENKYEMPSTDELVHHSGDPFLYGVAQRTMLQAEEAMFHSVVIKINLSANERALAIQKYRFKQGPEEIEEVKRAFKDKNFDFSKININNPFNPKAQYKGTNAEEYGVDAHASYGRVILGDTVAMLRNPVRFDSIFPDLLERFKKFHSFISEYRKLNNLNESYMNISGWIGMNPMGNTVDEASPKFRLEKDQNGVWKAKSVIDKTLPLSISGQVLTKELISKINEEQSDEKISAYKKASEKYNEAKLKSFQKRNATISSNSVISDIGKLKLAASSLDKKQAKKINEDHLRASRRLAIPNFFKERAQQRIDEAAKKVADKAKRDANKVANKAKRDAKKATASTTVEAP